MPTTPIIHEVSFVKLSDFGLSEECWESLSTVGGITWGNANYTLISGVRIMKALEEAMVDINEYIFILDYKELQRVHRQIGDLPSSVFIDMEN